MTYQKEQFDILREKIPGLSINESELVKDLINCLSNVKGKYILLDDKTKEFTIKGQTDMNVQI